MKYAALLRGIMPNNPKTRNENLRKVFESLGFTEVQTVIASGNVVFETREQKTATLEKRIEEELTRQLDFSKPVIIRSQKELIKLSERKLFKSQKNAQIKDLLVTFFKDQKPESLQVIERDGEKTTEYMRSLEKEHGKMITSRTGKTVERILKKMKA